MPHFEKISKYKDIDLPLPNRKTKDSGGYDFVVAEDTIVPSYYKEVSKLRESCYYDSTWTLQDISQWTKKNYKPTLVPTGMKCYLEEGTFLQLSVRSSCPLKNLLILANGVGIIDRDYVDNPDTEGHIFFQIINLAPFDIALKQGDRIGQGVILPYFTIDNDTAQGERQGGFGSTGN